MAKVANLINATIVSIACLSTPTVLAQEEQKTEVEYYKQDNITNRIPYFDNRFKIDAELEEITLIFYRESGSPPIILVRPDGSKLRINHLPEDNSVDWFDDRTFDMVTIRKPMPGPWQAIGQIKPDSKIMIVSDVSLSAEPLPEVLLAGETLKVIAKVTNQEKVVNDPLFIPVVNLDIDFYSTNNSNYDNFGAEPVQIGSFRDDGYELDEYARDGTFTGEFTLEFAPGEWVPIYIVKMPMATRELRQQPVIVRANPITMNVDITLDKLGKHRLNIDIDDSFVKPDSLVFQGKITFPDRQTEPFSIMEGEGKTRMKEFGYTEPGVHRVNLNAFGETVNGREFRLVVPEFSFNVEREELLVPTINENGSRLSSAEQEAARLQAEIEAKRKAAEEAFELAKQKQIEEAEAAKEKTYMTIAIINGIIVLIGIGLFGFFKFRKKKQAQ